MYIDAVYDSRRHWVWETTQSRISHTITQNATNPQHEHCGVLSGMYLHPHIVGVDCASTHYALCLLN